MLFQSVICGFVRLLCEALIFPLQERLDDWKKSVIQMDKDHAKGISTWEKCFITRICFLMKAVDDLVVEKQCQIFKRSVFVYM